MAKFNWYVKGIKQIERKPNVCYKQDSPGIMELLNDYLKAELLYLVEWHAQNTAGPALNLKERAANFDDFKLPLSLSAPQLGLIAQLFMDAGVFVVEKGQIMTVMKFLAAHVRTIGAEHLSADSLNKLRKRAEAKVCEAVERVLVEMLRLLRDVYIG